jgi:hypothetical protein
MSTGGQVLHLLLSDVVVDTVLDPCRDADRDRHALVARPVSLLPEYANHAMVAAVDHKPVDLPDLAVGGTNIFPAAHHFARGTE